VTIVVLLQIAGLIRDLGDEDCAVRERATAALLEAGAPAVTALREAARARDPEVRIRADLLLDRLLPVRAELSIDASTSRLHIRLVNDKSRAVQLLKVCYCVVGSFLPTSSVEVVDPAGRPVALKTCSALRGSCEAGLPDHDQFLVLPPGGRADPYDASSLNGTLCINCTCPNGLVLVTPGTYRVRFIYSTAGADSIDWRNIVEPEQRDDAELFERLARLDRVEIDTGWVELTVGP
jgi:hypothetical protein